MVVCATANGAVGSVVVVVVCGCKVVVVDAAARLVCRRSRCRILRSPPGASNRNRLLGGVDVDVVDVVAALDPAAGPEVQVMSKVVSTTSAIAPLVVEARS